MSTKIVADQFEEVYQDEYKKRCVVSGREAKRVALKKVLDTHHSRLRIGVVRCENRIYPARLIGRDPLSGGAYWVFCDDRIFWQQSEQEQEQSPFVVEIVQDFDNHAPVVVWALQATLNAIERGNIIAGAILELPPEIFLFQWTGRRSIGIGAYSSDSTQKLGAVEAGSLDEALQELTCRLLRDHDNLWQGVHVAKFGDQTWRRVVVEDSEGRQRPWDHTVMVRVSEKRPTIFRAL